MSESKELIVQFHDVSAADANELAGQLVSELREKVADSRPQVVKDDPATMDLGTTVAVILSTEAAVAIAYGIASILARWGARATISEKQKTADGTIERKIVLENVSGADAERMARAWKGQS